MNVLGKRAYFLPIRSASSSPRYRREDSGDKETLVNVDEAPHQLRPVIRDATSSNNMSSGGGSTSGDGLGVDGGDGGVGVVVDGVRSFHSVRSGNIVELKYSSVNDLSRTNNRKTHNNEWTDRIGMHNSRRLYFPISRKHFIHPPVGGSEHSRVSLKNPDYYGNHSRYQQNPGGWHLVTDKIRSHEGKHHTGTESTYLKEVSPASFKRFARETGPRDPALLLEPVAQEDHGLYRCRMDYRESPTTVSYTALYVASEYSVE